jgi:hypothetical protein
VSSGVGLARRPQIQSMQNATTIIDLIHHRGDVISDILSFCSQSYLFSGCVSKKWNAMYKSRNKKMCTSTSQCTTLNSMWEAFTDETAGDFPFRNGPSFRLVKRLRPDKESETWKLVRVKSFFLGNFTWDDEDIVRYARECVELRHLGELTPAFIRETLQEIASSVNRRNQRSVLFEVLEMYYDKYPEEKGTDVFTKEIANLRYLEILEEYVHRYERGVFNRELISRANNLEIMEAINRMPYPL